MYIYICIYIYIYIYTYICTHHLPPPIPPLPVREDVDTAEKLVIGLGGKIVRGPEVREWAPGYYYVLFEDPDGIRLEVNFVPGTGLLKNNANFNFGEEFIRVDGEDLTQ